MNEAMELSKEELEFLRWLLTYYILSYHGEGKSLAHVELAQGLSKRMTEAINE